MGGRFDGSTPDEERDRETSRGKWELPNGVNGEKMIQEQPFSCI